MRTVERFLFIFCFVLPLGGLLLGGSPSYHPRQISNEKPTHLSARVSNVNSHDGKFLDVNTIRCAIGSDGPCCDYTVNDTAGLTWPNGTNKIAVFAAGLWISGIHKSTGRLRTAVQNYLSEFQPGPILSTFNTATNDSSVVGDPNDPAYHVFKINKGDADLPADRRNPDYDQWPGALGAPYVDINGNGQWDAGIDTPRMFGDQELWCVHNDASLVRHNAVGVTPPMGIEIQATYFGFNAPGALGNAMFMHWKLINKSDSDYDSTYLSLWDDIDLGNGWDDRAACDTIRKLTYVYNGLDSDVTYGNNPPSDGFVFLQGPKVPAGSLDSALADGKWIRGFRNMSPTSHAVYFNPGDLRFVMPRPQGLDPTIGSSSYASEARDYQKGHIPYINPMTGDASTFAFPGDPVTESGWTETKSELPPWDVRTMLSAGPFTLAAGDTQDFVGAFVIAQGSDRLNSILQLRQYVDEAQLIFNNNFVTSVDRKEVPPLSSRYILNQNYPNPFNPSTVISFSLPSKEFVSLKIYDVIGREVLTLLAKVLTQGTYSVRWDGSSVGAGVYFCRLQAGSLAETRKLVLVK